jgi:hypothetical protein
LVGLLDFAGALVVRFLTGPLLARFLLAFFAAFFTAFLPGALLALFFVARFLGVRLVAMAPPGSGTLSETGPRASSCDAASAR